MPATDAQPATIGTLLKKEHIRLGLKASDKSALITELVDSLTVDGVDLDEVAEAVLERERHLSTGVGYGVALPHAKTSAVESTEVMFAVLPAPIDFDSFDKEPVRLVFLLVGPPGASRQHIQVLGRVSRILNDESVRNQLLEAKSPDDIIEIFDSAERKLGSR